MTGKIAHLLKHSYRMRLFAVVLLLFASLSMPLLHAQEQPGMDASSEHCGAMTMPDQQDGEDQGHGDTGQHGLAKVTACAIACACTPVGEISVAGPFRFESALRLEGTAMTLAGVEPALLLPPPKA